MSRSTTKGGLNGRAPDDATRLTAITYQGCADVMGCAIHRRPSTAADVVTGAVTPTTFERKPSAASAAPTGPNMTLPLALGLAFLGGLVLNAMPPADSILSLKVPSCYGDPREHCRHGLAYLAGRGVFVLIASVLTSLQRRPLVGWGFSCKPPAADGAGLSISVMGLSLSGLVLFGGRWMNLGAGLATAPDAGQLYGRTGGGVSLYCALHGYWPCLTQPA